MERSTASRSSLALHFCANAFVYVRVAVYDIHVAGLRTTLLLQPDTASDVLATRTDRFVQHAGVRGAGSVVFDGSYGSANA